MEGSSIMEAIPDDIKKEIWGYLKNYQTIHLATIDGDIPRVRPVTLAYLDSRFWLFTGAKDAKTMQIQAHPKVEFSLTVKKGENSGTVRAYGTANIVQDQETKAKMADLCEYFKDYWKTPDDPTYALIEFLIEEIEYMRPSEMVAHKYQL